MKKFTEEVLEINIKSSYKYVKLVCIFVISKTREKTRENINEPRSDKRDLLAIRVKSEIFTEKERTSCWEQ